MRDLLAPMGLAYSGLTRLREQLYTQEYLKSERLDKPVVSVGNLTVGGTGKTPLVDALLTQFENQNLRACVLTRGYGRVNASVSKIVDLESTPLDCGDEPVWLAMRHKKSSVVVGADRLSSSRLVKDVDVFILDDGLQHLKIKRDLDIVLLDCTVPHWHYRPLPWGYGRECFSGIKKSDLVILTRVNQVDPSHVAEVKKRVEAEGITQIFESRVVAHAVREVWTSDLIDIRNKKVFLVSGIANPQSFEKSARDLGADIIGHDIRPDHYVYSKSSLDGIISQAQRNNAEVILTTEKDSVKWKDFDLIKEPKMAQLEIEMQFQPKLPGLYDLALKRFR